MNKPITLTAPKGADAAHPVWPLWRALVRLFSVRSIFGSSVGGPGATRFGGADFIDVLRRNRTTAAVFALLEDTPEELIEGLAALAALNARRQERQFRSVALLYATIPVGMIAISGELVADQFVRLVRENMTIAGVYLLLFTFVLLWYSASLWRARQMVDVLDLVRVERNVRPFTAVELRDG